MERQLAQQSVVRIAAVESLAPELEVGIQRLAFVDAFYRTGNLPCVTEALRRISSLFRDS
jgi:hypothetical protein